MRFKCFFNDVIAISEFNSYQTSFVFLFFMLLAPLHSANKIYPNDSETAETIKRSNVGLWHDLLMMAAQSQSFRSKRLLKNRAMAFTVTVNFSVPAQRFCSNIYEFFIFMK